MSSQVAHKERAHAVLSASASSRWLACTPSAQLEATFPNTTSSYAEEGTLAHEIAELKLRKYYLEPMSPKKFSTRMNKLKKNELYQPEMDGYTDTYVEYLQKITLGYDGQSYVAIEKKVDFNTFVPDGFGTVDGLIIAGNDMYITDLKYGKGVQISAENNTQMMLYALGALMEYSFLYAIKNVHMAIIQPRLDNVSEFLMTVEDLLAWGESIKETARKAYAGEGEFTPGNHCKFCKAKATCRARAEQYKNIAEYTQIKKPPLLSNDEVGDYLSLVKDVEAWAKALKDYALDECLKGADIKGWKAVEGRASRDYADMDAAFAYLKDKGVDEAILFEKKPLTVPAVEKLLGKKDYRELLDEKGFIRHVPGKPTLVPKSDKRKAYTPPSAEDVFN